MSLRTAVMPPLVALLLLVSSLTAYADATPVVCDPDSKYWCFQVGYTVISGGVTVDTRNYKGGIDYNGTTEYWYRYITRDWHQDPNSTWILQADYGSGTVRSNQALSEQYMDMVQTPDNVATNAVVQMQMRFHDTGATPHFWCSSLEEYWLSPVGGPYDRGGGGPC